MHSVGRWALVLVVVAITAGIAGAAPVDAPVGGADGPTVGAEDPGTVLTDPPDLGLAECAPEPPDDFAPPADGNDTLGWHDGFWYNEPIDVDTTGGLTDEELDKVVARSMARWEALRCLPFEEDVPVEVIDRETFQEEHAQANVSDEDALFDNARALALFMAGQDEDAVELQEANRGESVGGFYSIADQEIVLVSGEDGEVHVNEPILGHELGHALQDQHFGLGAYAGNTTDGHNANLGLIEGEVVFLDTVYEGHCNAGAWADDCVMPPSDPTPPDLANLGLYLITIQPYSDGPNFAATLYEAGGWDAIDAVHDEYPASSKAVMYPELYPDFNPDHPPLEDTSSDDWVRLSQSGVDADHLGEPVLFASLVAPGLAGPGADSVVDPLELFNQRADGSLEPLNPYDYSHEYTDGWIGDRFVAFAEDGVDLDEDPRLAYTLDVVFEETDQAEAFHDAWAMQLELHGASSDDDHPATYTIENTGSFDGAYWLNQSDDVVTVVHAPTVEDLDDVRPQADEEEPDESDGIPGFTAVVVVVGMLGIAAAVAWRRR